MNLIESFKIAKRDYASLDRWSKVRLKKVKDWKNTNLDLSYTNRVYINTLLFVISDIQRFIINNSPNKIYPESFERLVLEEPSLSYTYLTSCNTCRYPDLLEDSISKHVIYSYMLARDRKSRFPKGEEVIMKDLVHRRMYIDLLKCIKDD